MVDDEPLIRKVVKMEMNSRAASVETGDLDASVVSRVEMVETFADGPALMAALDASNLPDYLLGDMELHGRNRDATRGRSWKKGKESTSSR